MIQINPREVAADVILSIMEEGAYNNTALRRALRQNGALERKDKALVTEIVNGTLRNILYIDFVINQFSKTKTEKMKSWILTVLRISIYQICFLDIPDSAACNEGVKLIESRGYGALKGFVNGVLRTVARQKGDIMLPYAGTAEYLSVCYSHPLWLVQMWIAYYGYEETKALCEANNLPPDVTIRVNTTRIDKDRLLHLLEKEGIEVSQGKYCTDALHIKGSSDIGRLRAFEEGLFHVQDESSQLAVEVLSPQKGSKVLDICAAPGGKSFTIAEKMENDGQVFACDIYEHKADLIAQGAKRLGLDCITVQIHDAAKKDASLAEQFDCVLVDAPCSGFGLIRKKPDIRLKKDGSEIDALVPLQRRILETASAYVKENGVLVYSTCTLSRKENEKNVEWFLKEYPMFEAVDISSRLPDGLTQETTKGISLFPHETGTDGFFIAKFERRG